MDDIDQAIQAKRAKLGLSRAKYGRLVGVDQMTVYRWEKALLSPSPENRRALVERGGLPKRYLPAAAA